MDAAGGVPAPLTIPAWLHRPRAGCARTGRVGRARARAVACRRPGGPEATGSRQPTGEPRGGQPARSLVSEEGTRTMRQYRRRLRAVSTASARAHVRCRHERNRTVLDCRSCRGGRHLFPRISRPSRPARGRRTRAGNVCARSQQRDHRCRGRPRGPRHRVRRRFDAHGVTVIIPHTATCSVRACRRRFMWATASASCSVSPTPRAWRARDADRAHVHALHLEVGDALAGWMLQSRRMPCALINPVVGETNDGGLNGTTRPWHWCRDASCACCGRHGGPCGRQRRAGHGTVMFGWKGGIGTSSRKLPHRSADTRSVCSCRATMAVCCRCRAFRRATAWSLRVPARRGRAGPAGRRRRRRAAERGDGSCMIVLPPTRRCSRETSNASPRARCSGSRAPVATRPRFRRLRDRILHASRYGGIPTAGGECPRAGNDAVSALFQAVTEATEEALYDAMLMATPVSSRGGRVSPLPVDSVRTLLRARGIGRR